MEENDIEIFTKSNLNSSGHNDPIIDDTYSNHSCNSPVYATQNDKESDTEDVLFTSTNQSLSETEHFDAATDLLSAKTKREQQNIMAVIENVKATKSLSTDLSRKLLQTIPEALLELTHLEYLYMEGNEISFLPEDFFKFFPCLVWLDLRNNMLCRIPSSHLSGHSCLRNLLLEGNNLCNLPLELGLVRSLHGLNIAGNPLEFPPLAVIETGTQGILQFLRDVMNAKNSAKIADTDLSLSKGDPDFLEHSSNSSDDWNTSASMMELARIRDKMKLNELNNLHGSLIHSKNVMKPDEIKPDNQKTVKKIKKFGDFLVIGEMKKMKENKMAWRVNHFPSPPTQEYVRFKMNEEKQLARVKEFKEKTDAILQRRRDDEMLKNWRDDAKVLQRKKYLQHLTPGTDYKEPAEIAPYDFDKEMMKVLSNEEFKRAELQRGKKLIQERSVSPASRQRMEQEKQAKIYELEKKIKDHMANMMARRKQPKGSVQQEMVSAKKDLEIIKKLQQDLKDRYLNLKSWKTETL
ncbi:hypothetical protein Btru_059469 [Bulinus truncatus]|nr:hypothetical protein Btru_059469 [Bulinus truncatus]